MFVYFIQYVGGMLYWGELMVDRYNYNEKSMQLIKLRIEKSHSSGMVYQHLVWFESFDYDVH